MKNFICFFLVSFFFNSFLHAQISIKNYKQPDEQTFYITDDTSSLKFTAKTPKKPIKIDPNLFYSWYKYNKTFVSQGGYDGRLLNGEYTAFYKSNNLKSKGIYKDGIKVDSWYEWEVDGKLKEVSNWKNGLKNGITNKYENGVLVKSETYKNNRLNGKTIKYHNGVQTISFYKNGDLKSSSIKKNKNPKKIDPQNTSGSPADSTAKQSNQASAKKDSNTSGNSGQSQNNQNVPPKNKLKPNQPVQTTKP